MHLFFVTRGVQHQVDQWHTWMQSQMFPWRVKDPKTGNEEVFGAQGALRPIQLWEYVFPEEHLQEVLTMLNLQNGNKGHWGNGWAKNKLAQAALRKVLGAEPVPNMPASPKFRFIYREGVGIEPIGIKKDANNETIWQTPQQKAEKEKSLGLTDKIREYL